MAVLTWRNVDAPNFSGVADAYRVSGQSLANASDGLLKAIDSYQEGKTQSASGALMLDAMRAQNPEELKAALASGTNLDPRYLNADAINFVAKYGNQLAQQDLAQQKLSILGSGGTGRRGGGGSGRRGSGSGDGGTVADTIVGNIDNNGNFTPVGTADAVTQAKPVASIIPDNIYVPPAPVAQARPSAPVDTAAISPVDPNIPAGGPTRENAAKLQSALASSDRTYGAPLEATVATTPAPAATPVGDVSVDIPKPVPGPVRVAKLKGKDGGSQINPEGFQDAVTARLTALTDPEAASLAAVQNPRFNRNLTMTNGLDFVKGNLDTRKTALSIEGDEIKNQGDRLKLNEATRNETEAARDYNNRTEARDWAVDLNQYSSPAEAIADLPRDDPEAYRIRRNEIEKADKSGFWNVPDVARVQANGEVVLPNYLTSRSAPASLGLSGSTSPAANVSAALGAATSVDPKAADAVQKDPALADKVTTDLSKAVQDPNSYYGVKLDQEAVMYRSAKNQLGLDYSGNTALPILRDFTTTLRSNASVSDAANSLSKNDRFKGVDNEDLGDVIRTVAQRGKINPALAAKIIENAPSKQNTLESLNPFTSKASDKVDWGTVDELLSQFVDKDGKPTTKILQEAEKVTQSDLADKQLDAAWANLQKAQADLEEGYQRKAANVGKGANIKALEKAAQIAHQDFNKIYTQLKDPNGLSYQNRGVPAAPPVAQVAPAAPNVKFVPAGRALADEVSRRLDYGSSLGGW